MNIERVKLIFFFIICLSLMYLGYQLKQTRELVNSRKFRAILDKIDAAEVTQIVQKLNTLDFDKVSSLINKIDSIDINQITQVIEFAGKIDNQVCTGNDGYLLKPGKAAAALGVPTVKMC